MRKRRPPLARTVDPAILVCHSSHTNMCVHLTQPVRSPAFCPNDLWRQCLGRMNIDNLNLPLASPHPILFNPSRISSVEIRQLVRIFWNFFTSGSFLGLFVFSFGDKIMRINVCYRWVSREEWAYPLITLYSSIFRELAQLIFVNWYEFFYLR